MQRHHKQLGFVFLLLAVASGAAGQAGAADVRAGLSARETYVGLPVTLRVQVSDAQNTQPPTIPPVDGLEIKPLGTPARSTQISSINGRTTTRSSLTFAFQVTPQRAGSFEIPPITVQAGGAERQTPPMSLVASKSETDDLLFVEIAGKEKQIYVGQALDVTLQIWIRPYRDREHNLTLSEGNMWQLVSERSTWGLFTDRMQQLAANDQRPVGKEVLRKDQSGAEHSYYLYEIEATIYPKREGKIDAGDTRIVVDYPTAIGKARDPFAGFFEGTPFSGRSRMSDDDDGFSPFGSRLAVQSVRPIVAETGGPSIEVLPIPTVDRPADYRGAVGKYAIATSATPSNVKAGDPIELSIGIVGSGPMDLVQAPPLAELPQLTADFKVPAEPLAGFVKDERKLFTTTIRPRRAGVTKIPSIPFSYFDPAAAKFVTVHSEPISIHVDPADTLAMDAIVGNGGGTTNADETPGAGAKPTGDATAALFTGDDLLISDRSNALSSQSLIILLAAPPVAVFALLMLRGYRNSAGGWLMFGSGVAATKRRVDRAQAVGEVAAALRGYASRQLCLGIAADDAFIVGALRTGGQRQLAIRLERTFSVCSNTSTVNGSTPQNLSDLKQDALDIINDFQVAREQKQRKPAPIRRAVVKVTAILLMIAAGSAVSSSDAVAANVDSGLAQQSPSVSTSTVPELPNNAALFSLTPVQQKLILEEANGCYTQGINQASSDLASAKQLFAQAVDKYQLLVQSGIVNSRLQTNLANAHLHGGQSEKAIAAFRRAIEIDSTNRVARRGLAIATQPAGATPSTSASKNEGSLFSQVAQSATTWVNSYLSPLQIQLTMLFGWFALWTALAARVLKYRLPWKSAVTMSALMYAIGGIFTVGA